MGQGGSIIASALAQKTERTALDRIFREEPPDLTTFVTSPAYLNNPPLSPIQYDAVRHLEQVFMPETYHAMAEEWGEYWKPVRYVNFGWIQWGKGSGKDHICRITSARVAHLLMCLRSAQDYYGMPRQDEIHTLNVASSAPQAHRAFFRPLKKLVDTAACFKGRTRTMEFSIKFDGGIESVSGHSDAETQEGLNIILGIADEISAFRTREEAELHATRTGGREPAKTSDAILKMMRTSARTRFPRTFKIAAISYPRFKGDAIQQLVQRARDDEEARGENSRVFASGPHATWEVNPRVTGKQEFQEDYDEDPDMAAAMYECKPSFSTNRVFRNTTAVHAAFAERREEDPIRFIYYWGRDETSDKTVLAEREGWQVRFEYAKDFYPMRGAIYTMHGDMAISADRAGVALAHVRNWQEGDWPGVNEQRVMESRPIVKLDFVGSFEADLKAEQGAREVQIRWYRKLIFELQTRGFYFGRVTFDNFQSTDTIQILESRGIESERVSMDRDMVGWNSLRDVMYDGRLEAYWRQRTVEELLGLTRLPNGKADHVPGGSKDEADAVAGAVLAAVELGGGEGPAPERADRSTLDVFGVGSWLESPEIPRLDVQLTDLSPPDM